MSENKIRVVTKLPNEDAKVREIQNQFREISSFCEGFIDMTDMPKDELMTLIYNDEFLINGMEPNIVLPEREGVICGPLIIAGYDSETGDTISLTDKQVEKALKYCARNNLHHMSLEGAYRYSKVIGPLQDSYDEAGIDEMEA